MDEDDILKNYGAVGMNFLFGNHTISDQDLKVTEPSARLEKIGNLPSLYGRITQTRLFRSNLMENGTSIEKIRELELGTRWKYGPALPPPTKDNPFSVGEPTNSGNFRDFIHEEGRIGFHDLLLREREKKKQTNAAILRTYTNTFGEDNLKQWIADLDSNRPEAMAAVTRYQDDVLKSHAFFEMDSDFVGMDFLKDRLWKLKKSYDFEFAFKDPSQHAESDMSMHMALLAPRGMGKTRVTEKALGPAMKRLGLITSAECVRLTLGSVAGLTLGAVETNLREAFERGKNGVVLFDEVDTVAGYMSKGQERSAISQIINDEAEKRRLTMALVVATYPEMADAFFSSDPGLPTRFGDRIFYMPEHKSVDFVRMFEIRMNKMYFILENDSVRSTLWEKVTKMRKEEAHIFGNGRTMREMTQFANGYLGEKLEAAGHSLSTAYGKKSLSKTERTITEADMDYIVKNFKLVNRPEKDSVYNEENPFLKKDKTEDPVVRTTSEVVPFPNSHQPKLLN